MVIIIIIPVLKDSDFGLLGVVADSIWYSVAVGRFRRMARVPKIGLLKRARILWRSQIES